MIDHRINFKLTVRCGRVVSESLIAEADPTARNPPLVDRIRDVTAGERPYPQW
jgi:hypothetical protein